MKNNSRRRFLSDTKNYSIATAGFYGLDNLLQILFSNAVANATEPTVYPYNYVNLLNPLAPPRWYFDQPLNPNNKSSEFIPGSFGTELKQSGGKWSANYKAYKQTFGGQNIYLPPLWNLKSAAGENFNSLLKNMIMFRGVDMEINSHQVNQERTVRPFSSSPSISGLVGERSSTPTPSIGYTTARTSSVFRGTSSTTGITVSSGNPIPNLIKPFNTTSVVRKDDLDYSIKQALKQIDLYARERDLSSQGSEINLDKTYDMFARNLSSYQTKYNGILNKYKNIALAETQLEIPEVNDRSLLNSIHPDGSPEFTYTNTGLIFNTGDNLKNIYNASVLNTNVANAFAFCEFALLEGLTSSLTLDLGTTSFSQVNGNIGISSDQHFVGTIPSVIFTTSYYRSVMACMLELRKVLTAKNLFDKTLFHFTAEFSRTPKANASGSDHGFNSSSTSFISGMIKENGSGLMGNIYTQSKVADEPIKYPGTWGFSAPTNLSPGTTRHIINDDIVSTVCEIMEVEKIGTKGQSLVKKQNGVVSLLKKESKNVV